MVERAQKQEARKQKHNSMYVCVYNIYIFTFYMYTYIHMLIHAASRCARERVRERSGPAQASLSAIYYHITNLL